MKNKIIKGRCPQCCPEGGACFALWGANEKKCSNCGLVLPFRRIKATGKPTPSQEKALGRIVAAFGGVPETRMIGRDLWVSLVNRERHWMLGDSLYGTIGPGGALEITLQVVGGDVKITDSIGVEVYLKRH